MSVSAEVQRTLVKSPPELWTELSSPEALARHLGEFGEIHIIKTEPETKVEWETEGASGVVQLKQSGWGTKVTLSVTRTPPAPEAPAEPEPVAENEPEPAVEPEPEPVATVEPEPEPLPEPDAHLGFFARLFRKRKAKHSAVVEPDPEPVDLAATETETEIVALAAPEPLYPDPPAPSDTCEPAEDLATELESLEAQMVAETTELLTGVLDRLGAAHHRPFSRG
jgi:hypothetical protein